MNIKDMIKKLGEMDSKHLLLVVECAVILAKLEEEEQDKLMELIDIIIEYQKKKWDAKNKSNRKQGGKLNGRKKV